MLKKLLSTKKTQAGFNLFRENNRSRQQGFTLIELLIVIAIIVIVIGVAAASYSTVAKNSRNAQRQSDMRKIADALELFYSDYKEYPHAIPSTNLRDCLTGASCNISTGTVTPRQYISSLPVDPQNNAAYGYTPGTDSSFAGTDFQTYTLTGTFEPSAPAGFNPLHSPTR